MEKHGEVPASPASALRAVSKRHGRGVDLHCLFRSWKVECWNLTPSPKIAMEHLEAQTGWDGGTRAES